MACMHIWCFRNQSYSHIIMAPSPRLSYLVTNQVPPFQEWHSAVISDHVGTNPTVTSEWISTHIWHGRNQSSHHDRMAQPLHLTYSSEWLSVPDWVFLVTNQVPPFQEWHSSLIYDHVGTNPTGTSEWINTHIWHGRNQSSNHEKMAHPLHVTIEGTNPLTMSEWLWDSSLSLGGNPLEEIWGLKWAL